MMLSRILNDWRTVRELDKLTNALMAGATLGIGVVLFRGFMRDVEHTRDLVRENRRETERLGRIMKDRLPVAEPLAPPVEEKQ